MARQTAAVVMQKLVVRRTALEANREELPQMEIPLREVDSTLTVMQDLTAQQASLTAAKQEVTKQLDETSSKAQKLMTFVDAGIRQHYGNRSEKLVEFGQQPFRSQPRVRLVGPDGKPVKKPIPAPAEPPAQPPTE